MILDYIEIPEFYSGVDWWVQHQGIWKNGHRITLFFGAKANYKLDSGLYIIDSESVVDMRLCEAVSGDYSKVEGDFNDYVFQEFGNKLRERLCSEVKSYVKNSFQLLPKGAIDIYRV